MMSPLQVEVSDGSGQSYRESLEKSDALGNVMAELALQALASAEPVSQSGLCAKNPLMIAVENVLFQGIYLGNV